MGETGRIKGWYKMKTRKSGEDKQKEVREGQRIRCRSKGAHMQQVEQEDGDIEKVAGIWKKRRMKRVA